MILNSRESVNIGPEVRPKILSFYLARMSQRRRCSHCQVRRFVLLLAMKKLNKVIINWGKYERTF
jgi:hypothetical protein